MRAAERRAMTHLRSVDAIPRFNFQTG
jgi:hypothetical protein